MITPGLTLRCAQAPYHIWVVLSDPAQTGGEIVMVNLTTLRERCVDDVCVLNESDYAELDRPTTVAYSRYHKGAATGLANAIQRRFFDCSVPQIPKETVLRILEGARASDQIPRAVKRLLASLPP